MEIYARPRLKVQSWFKFYKMRLNHLNISENSRYEAEKRLQYEEPHSIAELQRYIPVSSSVGYNFYLIF